MFRPSPSARLLRQSIQTSIRSSYKSTILPSSRRFLTTEPPHKTSRSWKNSATRWALAIGGVYWYNTTPLFAEQPHYTIQDQEPPLPTLASLSPSARFSPPTTSDPPTLPVQPSTHSPPSIDPKSPLPDNLPLDQPLQTPEDLEAEAQSQGAFNEETGEINWDCPCLGGMAHGPCGPEFRAAFECFVFSKDEPKGMDCVDKFKGMQTCFRAHPEEYGDQLEEDEDEVQAELAARESTSGDSAGGEGEAISGSVAEGVAAAVKQDVKEGGAGSDVVDALASSDEKKTTTSKRSIYDSSPPNADSQTSATTGAREKSAGPTGDKRADPRSVASKTVGGLAGDEGGELVPKAAHDATGN